MQTHWFADGLALYNYDCREVLPVLGDSSVDSVCTDPPYELGFMGKTWDASGAAYDVGTWKECFRVLKPGGYLLAFGGTRTYHRLASAIEDAGFEIRDSLHWLYGCLSADTEILTERGWQPGIEVAEGEQVAQWDAETGAVTLAPVQQVFRAPWDGPMRVLRNADTDQLLTPNHRVYHQPRQRKMTDSVRRSWYDGRWQLAEAGALSTWDLIRLPIAGEHDGPGIGGEDYAALLGWVWTEGGFDLSGSGVRIYQSSVNPDKVTEIAALLDRLGPHKRYDYQRSYAYVSGQREYTATTWFMSGDLAGRVRADLPGKRPTYPLLWRMTTAEKRAFLRAAMLGDGSGWGGKSEQFYQQHEDDLIWLQTLLALVGRSGKVGMRSNRPGGALYLRKVSMTELQAQHQRTAWRHYTGEVWCVRVPTGAFIARRNGRVFITGNSGFPKSLDVSKAIDKAAGAQREVVGRYQYPDGSGVRAVIDSSESASVYGSNRPGGSTPVTAPATPDAARWEGWGTALKPAHEPIVLARKPLAGTVAQNVLTHGTGALNVDGCRVGREPGDRINYGVDGDEPSPASNGGITGQRARVAYQPDGAGRWPPNVLLTHAADCDGECAPGCPVAGLDGQSGAIHTQDSASRNGGRKPSWSPSGTERQRADRSAPEYRDIQGQGASRFFPQLNWSPEYDLPFLYQAKASAKERPRHADGSAHPTVKPLALMRWLARLVTPPGGTVLDPFCGTGTTLQAARLEGFRSIGCDSWDQAAEMACQRLGLVVEADAG